MVIMGRPVKLGSPRGIADDRRRVRAPVHLEADGRFPVATGKDDAHDPSRLEDVAQPLRGHAARSKPELVEPIAQFLRPFLRTSQGVRIKGLA